MSRHFLSLISSAVFLLLPIHLLAAPAPAASQVSIAVPATAPTSAAGPVDHSFIGLAFEGAWFPQFAGSNDAPNQLSKNLVEAITSRVGNKPLYIRIGGTTWDLAPFDPNQNEAIKFPEGQEGHKMPFGASIGPAFFDLLKIFPNAKYIITVPAEDQKQDQATALAKAAYQRAGADAIAYLEIGNEPDLYVSQKRRPDGWGIAQHATEWKQYAQKINEAVKTTGNGNAVPKYEALALSSPSHPDNYWDIKDLFNDGLKDNADEIGTVSEHYYQTVLGAGSSYTRDVMSHAATTQKLSYFAPKIAWLRQNYPKISLSLGEVGQALPGKAGTFDQTQELTLGSALWGVDFMLKAMSMGIQFVTHQNLAGGFFNLFQPAPWTETPASSQPSGNPERPTPLDNRALQSIQHPAAVFPLFHACVAVADFIGSNTQVDLKVGELALPGQDQGQNVNPDLAAYAAWEGNQLKRMVVLNLKPWSATLDRKGDRGKQCIKLQVGQGAKKAKVRRLTAKDGWTAGQGGMEGKVSYGGTVWTTKDQGKGSKAQDAGGEEEVNVDAQGGLTVDVNDSEAVVILLES